MKHISEMTSADLQSVLDHGGDWHDTRAKAVGGSDANIIAKGDPEALEHLRQVKCGHAQGEDLTAVLPVQLGSWTEPLNRLWLARALAMEVLPGKSVASATHHFMRANTDGSTPDGGIVECKHCNAFTKADDVLARYYPQLQHNLSVTGAPFIYLSVFIGTDKHVWQKVERDADYITKLIAAEEAFWSYVIADSPIVEARGLEAAIPISEMRELDMSTNNAWAVHSATWIMYREEAKQFEKAGKELKALVEPDVRRAFCKSIEIIRDGRGLTVKEISTAKAKGKAA